MRKALIIGIDHYQYISNLSGCVNDAYGVKNVLERHADGTLNFPNPKLITSASDSIIEKRHLKEAIRQLFDDDSEIALLYFAGHGYIEDTGGYLCAGDCETGDDGLSLSEIMTLVHRSKARNKVIVLDSCHSGIVSNNPLNQSIADLSDGTTILTASTENQYAMEVEDGGAGVFTSLFIDALNGAAANLVGDVTPGSIYAHIDQSLGPWAQRPVFKTNVKTFVSLRKASAPIPLSDLQALNRYFPRADYQFPLDPSFEPERSDEQKLDSNIPLPNAENNEIFAMLQRYARVNLVRPVDVPHMWHAAMQNKSCELTVLGQHYWKLVNGGLL